MQYQLSLSVSLSRTFKSSVRNVLHFHGHICSVDYAMTHCSVYYFLIEMAPLFDQSLFEMLDVKDLFTVDALLQHAPYLVINWVEVQAVWRPLLWTDEARHLCFQQCSLPGTMSRCVILLDDIILILTN